MMSGDAPSVEACSTEANNVHLELKEPGNQAELNSEDDIQTGNLDLQVSAEPIAGVSWNLIPPGLDILIDGSQVVIHKDNLRINKVLNQDALSRLEVVNEMRRVLFHVEQVQTHYDANRSFMFKVYDRNGILVMDVFCPLSSTCICCNSSFHCCSCCRFQAVLYCPVGVVVGFTRQAHTRFVHEFELLDPSEMPVLRLKGALNDLEIYNADLTLEIGRLSRHGWMGIMHELRRSNKDWGLTFPIDLDVKYKAGLIGTALCVDWLNSKAGTQ